MDKVIVAYIIIATGMVMYAVVATFGWLATIALVVGGMGCLTLMFIEDEGHKP